MRSGLQPRRHMTDLLFILALFCVFAASSLLVVLIGANVYQSTVRGMNRNFDLQTSLTYVATQVRQNDTAGAVSVGRVGDSPALVLQQRFDDEAYQTLIYRYDGSIRELFAQADNEVFPEEGRAIVEVGSFELEQPAPDLVRVRCTDPAGAPAEVTLYLNCGEARG